ncbi:MAG: competence/damage-inducible protein A [Phycisphaeraceae bacterium]|nr:competence/damage-inducible protein A [Phycisphaeraceae bacterium]
MSHRTGAVLSIGDELTLGQTLDTNSKWVSDRLLAHGVVPVEHATVPDDRAAIAAAIRRLAERADLVVVTGGLGPTADDLTRAGLADAMGDQLVEDAAAVAQIEAYFRARGTPMREINRVQAQRPRRGVCLANPNGTAPGLYGVVRVAKGDVDVVCLPGPPREMKPMFEAEVVPRLKLEAGRHVMTRALHTFGLGESEIATRLGPLMDRDRNPTVGTTASQGVVSCRIRYEGAGDGASEIGKIETEVRTRLGPYVFGADGDTMASVVLDLLRRRGEALSTVESCTGGLLGTMLTDVPGSSDVYVGGWVTYTNTMKTFEIGVPAELITRAGAVSREVAEAMARGGRERSGAAHALAITGIAGPGGGSEAKPVGTVWIARSGPGGDEARKFLFVGERANVRDWSARSALAMLRLALIGERGVKLGRQVE